MADAIARVGDREGVAWALGLWTSLYEPVICSCWCCSPGRFGIARFSGRRRGCPAWRRVGSSCCSRSGSRDGVSTPPRGSARVTGRSFSRRGRGQIGELASVPPWSATLYAWSGLALVAAPVLLLLNRGGRPCPCPGKLAAAGRRVRADLLAVALGIFPAAGLRVEPALPIRCAADDALAGGLQRGRRAGTLADGARVDRPSTPAGRLARKLGRATRRDQPISAT